MKRQIYINKKLFSSLLVLMAAVIFAQEKQVDGIVLDDLTFEPIVGATLSIEGKNTTATTSDSGEFSILVEVGDMLTIVTSESSAASVQISEENYYEILISGENIQLEQVVAVGYTEERKSDLAGAISIVSMDEVSQEFSPNIITALQGRVPGIQVNSGGTPGGNDSQIAIRGLTTVTAGSSPLWVVDGVQTFNPAALNPDEIESIQVLKDGASAAIYGTSAANGVIVVTTKKGKNGISEFSFKSEVTINMLRDKIDVLNARQWLDVMHESYENDGISPPALSGGSIVSDGEQYIIPEFLDAAQLLRTADTDWVDAIIDDVFSQNIDLGYRYGKNGFLLNTSVNYTKDNGTQKYTFYERYNARLNTSYKFWKDKITIGENFLYSNFTEVKANELESSILQNPLLPIYTVNGEYSATTIQDKPNTLANLWANRKNEQRNQRFLGNVFADIEPIEGLTLSTKLNFDLSKYRFDTRTQPFVQMNSIPSGFRRIDVDRVDNEALNTIWTNLIQYEKEIGKHRFNAFAGLEFTRGDEDFLTERIRGVDISEYPLYIILPDAENQTIENYVDYRKQSQFAQLKYIFDDRYIISGSIRRDGSSRFGPNNKYGVFPAVSAAWNAINESFMQNLAFISDLKFRASWGVNGNDLIGNYLYQSTFVNNTTGNIIEFADYDIDGDGEGALAGILQARQANPDIKWEETSQTNVGVDLAFLQNQFSVQFDWFDKRTKNLLLRPITLAIQGEAEPPIINAGEVSNKGFEFVVSYQNKRRNEFKYGIDFNLSHYKNNVESLDTDNNFLLNSGIAITQPGSPIASFYGLIADGIFRTPEEVAVHANQPGKDIGRIRFRDLNQDGTIDSNDRTIIGNPHPDFIYGINLTASYKGFDFNVYLDGKQGNDIYNTQRYLGDFTYFSFNFGTNTLDAWSQENANSNIPALSTLNSNNETTPSSYFVEDGSYLRAKTITIGYTLPTDLSSQMRLSDVRFYLVGQNLFTKTSFTGFDYEVGGLSAGGIGIAGYGIPHNKSITLGISAKF